MVAGVYRRLLIRLVVLVLSMYTQNSIEVAISIVIEIKVISSTDRIGVSVTVIRWAFKSQF